VDELSFTDLHVRRIAAPGSYDRGLDYLDAVTNLRLITGQATATVHGTVPYAVTLTTRPRLAGWCNCPHGADGNFCKHCVAVALTLLDLGSMASKLAETAQADDLIEIWLEGMPREQLHGLLIEIFSSDTALRDRFAARAATAVGDTDDIRSSVAGLLSSVEPLEDIARYVAQVWEIVKQVDEMIADGRAGLAICVAQDAIESLATAWDEIEDDSPRFEAVTGTLAELHAAACHADPPESAALARWLLDHAELVDPLGYIDILDESGIAILREDPELLPHLLAALGEVDELIAVQAADLAPDGSTHAAIAAELDIVGRHHEAADWARQGIRQAGERSALPDLVEYVSRDYAEHDQFAEAAALRRAEFEKSPGLQTFKAFREAAIAAGTWKTERSRTLELLSGPLYIDALIEDRDIITAWEQRAAHATLPQQLRLADLIAAELPRAALDVYHPRAQELRRGAGNAEYRALVKVLVKMRDCHERLGTQEEFQRYAAAVRADARRKRNLLAMMDEASL
jgi:uncharacterized Zn finger protein